MPRPTLQALATRLGAFLQEKNEAYGSAFEHCDRFLRILYPSGVRPEQYQDMLLIVRIFDKQMRIANKKHAFGEDPFKDIAGYGLLGLWKDIADDDDEDADEGDR